jgi:hypothetical protein
MTTRIVLLACILLTAASVSDAEPSDVIPSPDPLVSEIADVEALARECSLYDECEGQTILWCQWEYDIDCGDRFCRRPADQCDGELSTFQRVEHWYVCATRESNLLCFQNYVGRWLVSCGC